MSNDLLNFIRVWAIWDHVPAEALTAMAEWVIKNQISSGQVKMNQDKASVEVRSQIQENMRLKRCVDLPSFWPPPTWFRISISEAEFKGPRIAVVGFRGQLIGGSFITEGKDGERKMIHPFRDGNVVRCWRAEGGKKVDVHYMRVEDRGDDGFYLVISPVYETFINQFSGPEDLERFFRENKTPENLQDILTAMVGFSRKNGKIFNPQWDGVLAALSTKTDQEGDKTPAEKKPEGFVPPVGTDKPHSEKKERRHSREGGRSAKKKPRPEVPEDQTPVVKPGASSKDFKEGVED